MIDTNLTDAEIALQVIRRLVGEDADFDKLFYFVHQGDPKAKSRPRFTRNGKTYTPQETITAQERLTKEFVKALGGFKFDTPVAIAAVFFRSNFQRIDADNLMKLVLDAGTKADAWVDDCYITAQSSFIEFDRENPRSIIVLVPTKSSLDRSFRFTCQICNKKFDRKGRAAHSKPPKFCSTECRQQGYVLDRATANCLNCYTVFTRETARQRYCSKECGQASRKVRKLRTDQQPPSVCEVCGDRVSRREYRRCANCSPKGRKAGSKNKPKAQI